MNIIAKLTLKYMKLNKRRTFVTILGTIISVSMLTAVFTTTFSFKETMQQIEIKSNGLWQLKFSDVRAGDLSIFQEDTDIEHTDVSVPLGISFVEELSDKNHSVLSVEGHSDFSPTPVHLSAGRLPQKEGELIVSQKFASAMGGAFQTGSTLSLQVGQQSEDFDFIDPSQTEIKETVPMSFKVVGIFDSDSSSAPYTSYCYTDPSKLSADARVSVTLAYKDFEKLGTKIYDKIDRIYEQFSNYSDSPAAPVLEIHTELLLLNGITEASAYLITIFSALGLIILIIGIGSVSLIYNSFAISLGERSRTMGMLSSVGATKKQKRASVFFEACVIGLIAIPLGLLCGTLGIWGVFQIINPLLPNMGTSQLHLDLIVSPACILGILFFSVLILIISAAVPAFRASRIAPIRAIRQTDEFKITPKSTKGSPFVRKRLGFEAELGLKNIKRSKKQYRVTVFSLVMSIVMFIGAASFSQTVGAAYSQAEPPSEYNVFVSGYDAIPESAANDFMNVHAEEKVSSKMLSGLFFENIESKLTKEALRLSKEDGTSFYPYILTMDDEAYQAYLKKTGISADTFPQNQINAVLVNSCTYKDFETGVYTTFQQLNVKPGNSLTLQNITSDGTSLNTNVTLSAVADQKPSWTNSPAISSNYYSDITIIVPEKDFTEICRQLDCELYTTGFCYRSSQPDQLEQKLLEIKESYGDDLFLSVYNADRNYRTSMGFAITVYVFLYGFVVLIALICLSNIINTISTGMALRTREFAMLKSYGMTPKGFRKMMRFEILFYVFKTIIYGIPLSFLIIFLFNFSIQQSVQIRFTVPWLGICVSVAAVVLLVSAVVLTCGKKAVKQPITDTLKNENI